MKMVLLQAESQAMSAAGTKAEEVIETIKGWLS